MNFHDLSFVALGLTFLSFWIVRRWWVWAPLFAASLYLALDSGVIKPLAFAPIIALAVLTLTQMKNQVKGLTRFVVFVLTVLICAGLNYHYFPDFSNWNVSGNFWINFDKPLIGLFVLAFGLPLVSGAKDWTITLFKSVILAAITIGTMIFLATFAGAVNWQPKCPPDFFLRIAVNLFLVTIPEEAFFRGFVQNEVLKWAGSSFKGAAIAVLTSSLLFTVFHLTWAPSPALLAFVFIAGLFYGAIYQYTKRIEASIFTHFALNLVHMCFFSYHAI